MLAIELKGITKTFDGDLALAGIDLQVRSGERMIVLGCSGAGKTTLLRIVAGLEKPDQGTVLMQDIDRSSTPAGSRSVAMVSQDFALYPQLTVRKNLLAGMRKLRLRREERDRRVAETLDWFRIRDLESHLPSQLSGGEAQRAAFAKAVIVRPKILLLDEPLSQVDNLLKESLLNLIVRVSDTFDVTTMMVTHDPMAALRTADRIAIIHAGNLIDVGAPTDLYRRPVSKVAASLMSPMGMNWLDANGTHGSTLLRYQPENGSNKRYIGFRPEDVLVGEKDSLARGDAAEVVTEQKNGIVALPSSIQLKASVTRVQNLGFGKLVFADIDGQTIRVLCGNEFQSAASLRGMVSPDSLCWVDE